MSLAPEFTLTDHTGAKFKLGDQRGKVVLIFFGFSHCPEICPVSMMTLKRVKDHLKDERKGVRVVFITVDPDRDHLENLQEYVRIYDDSFVGLRGSPEELDSVYKAYGIYRERDVNDKIEPNYLINHTNSIFVIDKAGNWRLNHTDLNRVEDIIHDVRLLLHE